MLVYVCVRMRQYLCIQTFVALYILFKMNKQTEKKKRNESCARRRRRRSKCANAMIHFLWQNTWQKLAGEPREFNAGELEMVCNTIIIIVREHKVFIRTLIVWKWRRLLSCIGEQKIRSTYCENTAKTKSFNYFLSELPMSLSRNFLFFLRVLLLLKIIK